MLFMPYFCFAEHVGQMRMRRLSGELNFDSHRKQITVCGMIGKTAAGFFSDIFDLASLPLCFVRFKRSAFMPAFG